VASAICVNCFNNFMVIVSGGCLLEVLTISLIKSPDLRGVVLPANATVGRAAADAAGVHAGHGEDAKEDGISIRFHKPKDLDVHARIQARFE